MTQLPARELSDGHERQDRPGGHYPPPMDPSRAGYYPHEAVRGGHPGDGRAAYAPLEHSQPGPYPNDPRGPPAHYLPPQQWSGQPQSSYPPPSQYPDPSPTGYHYPPPPRQDLNPPQPQQPDPYRLPPPFPPGGYPYGHPPHYPQPPPPAPRQRTAIACKYCRKRKIRCSGYEASNEGRCNNCVRFNQQCLFHPVSAQAAFVPAQAVYGPMGRGARDSAPSNQQGDYRHHQNGEPPMLYGAHGQPLGPSPPHDTPPHGYPPPHGYATQAYQNGTGPARPPQGPPPQYDYRGPPPQREDNVSRKRPPPDDGPHNEDTHSSQSPHPSHRPRNSATESRATSTSGYDYPDPTNIAPTSPATSTMSYSSHPPAGYYANGSHHQPGRNDSPQSANSYDSPRVASVRHDGRTPPPGPPNSAGSVSGRNGMSVRDMLGGPAPSRDKSDNEMLNKLDGKKK